MNPEKNLFHTRLECDLSDERYLYTYGEYIGDNERKMAEYLSQIPQEQIEAIERITNRGQRAEVVPVKDGLKILRVVRQEEK